MNSYSGADIKKIAGLTGRCYLDAASENLYFNWSASAIEFDIEASELELNFVAMWAPEYEGIPGDTTAPFHKNWPWVRITCDGVEVSKQEINEEKFSLTIAQALNGKKHRIKITKLTENLKTELGLSLVKTDGEIFAPALEQRKRIEFVGDSITCGFGDKTNTPARLFYTSEEDALIAHGPLAAELLNMDYSLVSVSGICSTTNTGLPMEYAMDQLYAYTDRIIEDKLGHANYEAFDFAANPNDYVVINLGTNDGTGMFLCQDEEAELARFKGGYKNFLSTVRKLNGPDTKIICALGNLNYYLLPEMMEVVDDYKKESGDTNVIFYRYRGINPMDGMAACNHPTAITQEKMAKEIAAVISMLEEA